MNLSRARFKGLGRTLRRALAVAAAVLPGRAGRVARAVEAAIDGAPPPAR